MNGDAHEICRAELEKCEAELRETREKLVAAKQELLKSQGRSSERFVLHVCPGLSHDF